MGKDGVERREARDWRLERDGRVGRRAGEQFGEEGTGSGRAGRQAGMGRPARRARFDNPLTSQAERVPKPLWGR